MDRRIRRAACETLESRRLFAATGLKGEYFDNADLTGRRVSRIDAGVNFDWGLGSPEASIDADTFSARWQGEILPQFSETYTFHALSDDGVRLWVNGQLIINQWVGQTAYESSGSIALQAGQRYAIRLEYFDQTGAAQMKLSWSSPSRSKQIIPSDRLIPAQANGLGSGLGAAYYDNSDFTNAKIARVDSTIDFDWAGGSPHGSIDADTFSARWQGQIEAPTTETYTLYTQSDDGVRLWLNGSLLIDNWSDHVLTENSANVSLTAGQMYDVRVEYKESSANAVMKLLWSSASVAKQTIPSDRLFYTTGTGLRGEYFDNASLSGASVVRRDGKVDFDWQNGSPDASIQNDSFSVRWTGQVQAPSSGTYTFYTQSDDGVRLWIDNTLLVDNWTDHGITENSGTIALVAGRRYDMRMEYYDKAGGAIARLLWAGAGVSKQVIPTSNLFQSNVSQFASFVNNGMRVYVDALAGDTFRISASPANGDPDSNETSPVYLPGSDRSSFTYDPLSGRMEIRRDGNVVWNGDVRQITGFGHMGVTGSQIAWNAVNGETIFGLGERFDSLNQWGKRVSLWIEDAPGQGDGGKTYYATPVVYSSRGYALFATDNPESIFDFSKSIDGVHLYQRASPSAQFYIAVDDSFADLVKQRAAIQGLPGTVPDWSWGPWISKNSYEDRWEAEAAIRGNLERGNPVAAIVLEAWKGGDSTGNWNDFAWDRWPDVETYFNYSNSVGVKNILWQLPVIHPSSPEYAYGVQNDFFVRRPDGSVSLREHWMAGYANIDFTNPAAVAWWKNMMRWEVGAGVYGFKADDGEDIKPDDVFFDGRRGWQMHNEYSTLYDKALGELMNEERPGQGMLWARSGSLGSEAYPGLWAGDQGAEWLSIRRLISAGLSTGISGQPFWGHDIGGYFGTPSAELYMRWSAFGALSPFMQYHGQNGREPWLFGDQAQAVYRKMAYLRMNLVPTFIALGQEASQTGIPIMRPMALQYPNDSRFAFEDQQYMLGADMLVTPVMEEGASGRWVKFPQGSRWVMALTGRVYDGGTDQFVPIAVDEAPLFFREGATVLAQTAGGNWVDQYVANKPANNLVVRRPVVTSSVFDANGVTELRFTFDQDLANRPGTGDLIVRRNSDGHLVMATAMSYDPASHTITYTLPATFPAGDYTATLTLINALNAIGMAAEGEASLGMTFVGDVGAPIVVTPAAASSTNSTALSLSVLGNDDRGEVDLTYTWSVVGMPPSGVTFVTNGTNAAKNTIARLTKAGSYTFHVTIADAAGNSVISTVTANVELGAFTESQDIGAPSLVGGLVYDAEAGTYRMTAAGADIWGTSDQFQFASADLAETASIVARISSLTDTDPWAKAGVMMRDGSNANAAYAAVLLTPANGISFQWRSVTGAVTNSTVVASGAAPRWVKLHRIGNVFTAFQSADGLTWTQVGGAQTVAVPTSALAGIAVSSHDNNQLGSTTFSDVSIAPVARPTLASVVVNDGAVQRSMVTSVAVNFDRAVTLSTNAVTLWRRASASASATQVAGFTVTPASGSNTAYTLAFTAAGFVGRSLADGIYEVRVAAAGVTGVQGLTMNSDASFTFHRLFGDADGNRFVNNADQQKFKLAYGTQAGEPNFNAMFDYDGNHFVNNADQQQFKLRYGSDLSY